jgi:hypothetical protein
MLGVKPFPANPAFGGYCFVDCRWARTEGEYEDLRMGNSEFDERAEETVSIFRPQFLSLVRSGLINFIAEILESSRSASRMNREKGISV